MSKRCRHSWRYRNGIYLDGAPFGEVVVCWHCGARGIESLGPANDSNLQQADEIHAADWMARCDSYQEPRCPYGDGDGWISLDVDGDGWPWDPTRPLAGQYEEW